MESQSKQEVSGSQDWPLDHLWHTNSTSVELFELNFCLHDVMHITHFLVS